MVRKALAPADLDPQLEEFAADAFGAPGDVLSAHLFDQGDGFGRDPGLRRLGFGLAAPGQAEQLSVPAKEPALSGARRALSKGRAEQ